MFERMLFCKPSLFVTLSVAIVVSGDFVENATDASAQESKTADITKALRPYSKVAITHYNSGVKLHQSGFLSRSIQEYQAAINADCRMAEAWSNMGVIYANQREISDALKNALAANPNDATLLNCYGVVLSALGKSDDAIDQFRQAIARCPTFRSSYYNLAFALRRKGCPKEAKTVLAKAAKDLGEESEQKLHFPLVIPAPLQ
jgi:Tfp pilus assembly protein PilF